MSIFDRLFRKKSFPVGDPPGAGMWRYSRGYADIMTERLTSPYRQHPVVHAAIRSKARNIAQVPFELFRAGSDKVVTAGPVYRLLTDINPHMTMYQFFEAVVTALDIDGESMWYPDTRNVNGLPVYYWRAPASDVTVAKRGTTPVGWNIKIGNVPQFFGWDQVMHFRYYNPHDDLRGLSPLASLAVTLESDYSAMRYNGIFFANDGTPGGVLSTEQQLTDAQYERLKTQMIDRRRGVNNAHSTMLLDGGLKYQQVAINNHDMQFLDLRKHAIEEIAMVLGVPKSELQETEAINYATTAALDINYWRRTLIPLLRLIEGTLNSSLLNAHGFEGYFNVRAIDALNREILEKVEAARGLYSIGVPLNLINERLGLDLGDDIPYGDEPHGVPREEKAVVKAAPEVPEVKGDIVETARRKQWNMEMRRIAPIVGRCSKAVRDYFFRAEQRLIRRLLKSYRSSIKSGVDWGTDKAEIGIKAVPGDMFGDAIDPGELARVTGEHIRAAAESGYLSLPRAVVRGSAAAVARVVQARTVEFVGITERLQTAIRERVAAALIEELTEDQRAQAIVDAVRQEMEMAMRRARTIARTEVHSAYSSGAYKSMEDSGAKWIQWIASRDERVRESHMAIDGETVKLGDRFSNGLMHPLDSEGDPGEIINCRCVGVARYEEA